MVERLIDREELLLDTPFPLYPRRRSRRGRAEGREEGRTEAALAARRRSLLDVLVVRFDPGVGVSTDRAALATITDEAHLAQLLAAAVRAESVADFQATMSQEHRLATGVVCAVRTSGRVPLLFVRLAHATGVAV